MIGDGEVLLIFRHYQAVPERRTATTMYPRTNAKIMIILIRVSFDMRQIT